jgi:imidazolonepropionase-like amidohydrolase
MDDLIGTLEPGKRADVVAVRPAPGGEPGDPCAAALDPAARVELALVDGRVILDESGPTRISRPEAMRRASESRARLV